MTEKAKTEIQSVDQKEPIVLDLDKNTFTVNDSFKQTLAEAPAVIDRARTLLKTDIDNIDEEEMTALNKEIKPLIAYEKKFNDFTKSVKTELKNRDQVVLDQLSDILDTAGFSEIPATNKQLRQLQKDFKANRANKRWQKLGELFHAQLETYPELAQLAPDTLANFNNYRLNHADLVSEAKSKPINDATIKQLNEDLFNYHEDLGRLTDSTVMPAYYHQIVEQYAAEPTTNKMLNLIEAAQSQQLKDQQAKILDGITLTAKHDLNELWYQNEKLMASVNHLKYTDESDTEFNARKLNVMKTQGIAILNAINKNEFIDGEKVNATALRATIKTLCENSYKNMVKELSTPKPTVKENVEAATKKEEIKKPKVPTDPYSWLLDYMQAQNWADAHNNDKIKFAILRDLFAQITKSSSVWREHVKSNTDVIEITKYITNL